VIMFKNYKRKLLTSLWLGLILLGVTLLDSQEAYAACNFFESMTPASKNVSWSSTCTVTEIDGIDMAISENSITNTAVLTLLANSSLTINSTGQLVIGSVVFSGGNIAIQNGGSIKTGAPLYVTDANSDGLADDFTLYLSTASGRRRLGLMKSFEQCVSATRYRDADGDGYGNPNDSIFACETAGYVANNLDCNDSNSTVYRDIANLVTDTDKDGYSIGSAGTRCVGASTTVSGRTYYYRTTGLYDSLASAQSLGTDCYDSNANARPGSTYCGTTNRGDGSYDYNCSSSNTYCGTSYYVSTSYAEYERVCGPNDNTYCCPNGSNISITGSQVGCGVTGVLRGASHCWCSGCCGAANTCSYRPSSSGIQGCN
jgi:hypothetical protein